ncbi:hypothetical protein A2U01_0094917 [Trifolium medium]|uniref:Uncharacterized protein n=1 Tax=Trifolium medium TaxID=97028 RepID=A0A392UJ52_9FABA|nr:hypothetical protein [Trifolium medium]
MSVEFVITYLGHMTGVPSEAYDDIVDPPEPIGKKLFSKAQRAADRAIRAAKAATQPPPPP